MAQPSHTTGHTMLRTHTAAESEPSDDPDTDNALLRLEIIELQDTQNALTTELLSVQAELEETKTQLKSTKQQRDQAHASLERLHAEKQTGSPHDDAAEAERQFADSVLLRKVSALEDENAQLRKRVEKLLERPTHADFEENARTLHDEAGRALSEMEADHARELANAARLIEESRSRSAAWEGRYARTLAEGTKLKGALALSGGRVEALLNRVAEMEAERTAAEAALKRVCTELRRADELASNLHIERASAVDELARAHDRIDDLSAALAHATGTNETIATDAKASVAAAEKTVKALQAELSAARRGASADLREASTALVALRHTAEQNIFALQAEVEVLRSRAVSDAASAPAPELEHMREQLCAAQSANDALTRRMAAREEEHRRAANAFEDQISSLRIELSRFQAVVGDQRGEATRELTRRIEEQRAEHLETQLQMTRRVKELEIELKGLRESEREAKEDALAANRRLSTLAAHAGKLGHELEELKQAHSRIAATNSSARAQIAELKEHSLTAVGRAIKALEDDFTAQFAALAAKSSALADKQKVQARAVADSSIRAHSLSTSLAAFKTAEAHNITQLVSSWERDYERVVARLEDEAVRSKELLNELAKKVLGARGDVLRSTHRANEIEARFSQLQDLGSEIRKTSQSDIDTLTADTRRIRQELTEHLEDTRLLRESYTQALAYYESSALYLQRLREQLVGARDALTQNQHLLVRLHASNASLRERAGSERARFQREADAAARAFEELQAETQRRLDVFAQARHHEAVAFESKVEQMSNELARAKELAERAAVETREGIFARIADAFAPDDPARRLSSDPDAFLQRACEAVAMGSTSGALFKRTAATIKHLGAEARDAAQGFERAEGTMRELRGLAHRLATKTASESSEYETRLDSIRSVITIQANEIEDLKRQLGGSSRASPAPAGPSSSLQRTTASFFTRGKGGAKARPVPLLHGASSASRFPRIRRGFQP